MRDMFASRLVSALTHGGICVIPTDTLLGIVACAKNRRAVRRLYRLRRVTDRKPFVILIESAAALADFGIALTAAQQEFLKGVWPGKVSVIFRCPWKRFAYLHLGVRTLAFRVPGLRPLQRFLGAVGPLVAPSANPEGEVPAETISQARQYFGKSVDFYARTGKRRTGTPSTIVSLVGDAPRIVRQGAVRLSPIAGAYQTDSR